MVNIKQKQWMILSFVLGAFLIVFLLIWMLTEKKESAQVVVEKKETTIQPVTPPLQEIWVDQTQSQTKILQKKVDILTEQLKQFESLKKDQSEQLALIQGLKKDLETSSPETASSDHKNGEEKGESVAKNFFESPFEGEGQEKGQDYKRKNTQSLEAAPSHYMRRVSLNLQASQEENSHENTVEDTIPAGSFAAAILVGGVDALTGTTASSDPQPVLLRLVDHGTLPRGFHSDVKNCHVLASAYGDKSSERVMMRLVKMSCVEIDTGIIHSMPIKGYVSGEDGKTGVRGVKVDLSGPMVRNSLVGGFFSGISEFFSAQNQRAAFPISPLGQSNALGAADMLKAGTFSGTGKAMEKYADYWIKQAEQLQPVLQVAAGRRVTVVWTEDASLKGQPKGE